MQDSFTARQLLNDAYNLVGIKRRDEVIDGAEANFSLRKLNEILASSQLLVPYLSTISFFLTPGKDTYILGNTDGVDINTRKIVSIDYALFKINDQVWKINILGKSFNSRSRPTNVQTLPYNVLLQNTTYTSVLTFYPIPDKNYQVILSAKQSFDDLELDDRLDEIPTSLYMFFEYALARELVEYHGGVPWSQKLEATYQDLMRKAEAMADIDLTVDSDNDLSPYGAAAVLNGY